MHYINGRPAKEGDFVIVKPTYTGSKPFAGVLHSISAQATTCNGQVAKVVPGGVHHISVTLGTECLHIEDGFDGYLNLQSAPDAA